MAKEALKGVRCHHRKHIINSIKYIDDLMLLAKKEETLQDTMERLVEAGKAYGIEIKLESKK